MKKVKYLFERDTELKDINYQALIAFKARYFQLLEEHPFPPAPTAGSHYEMINYLKRKDESKPINIGVYHNITPMEAANRIASDLVIINGLIQLVASKTELKEAKFTLRLGTTHHIGKGDFTIKINGEEHEGEAFNVAPTFLKSKMNTTTKKWLSNDILKHILINEEAFAFIGASLVDKRVFKVENWHV
ncbi:hypothetical protein SAMN05444372_11092 [Flavobacterium micromati]|uniref:Uncharacterized protein n=1 Tax=Flavobacterium micromati TaxID=229205 RepID=A0A1M5MYN2_9FLAO|nr:hypothetical protein [Flavobacterium micromati]SHG82440.1 hypothetical protein SAMN05444372_11092 [Flavobacterium micromati]